ncbi:Monoculm1B [Panicum miliaceum]|uniref:Monoculm1B n=1 Tax=Panicum miliaceum TaxID=4540 RepID=A0A3L6PS03_PANMI|nr:Monoculm1B [Panicum miliaceum]
MARADWEAAWRDPGAAGQVGRHAHISGTATRPAGRVSPRPREEKRLLLRAPGAVGDSLVHLTANQAILDVAANSGVRHLQIVDLDATHGVQWPPLLQAIADHADPDLGPPEVRITSTGPDRDMLLRTGNRLRAFAGSFNLPFRFHPLLLPYTTQPAADPATELELQPDETLAVNCVLFARSRCS